MKCNERDFDRHYVTLFWLKLGQFLNIILAELFIYKGNRVISYIN